MTRIAPLAAAAALLALCACHTRGPSSPRAGQGPEIPITRVILYQNGVGYFERAGQVRGDSLTLQIRPTQINDLLKSLTVIDRGDGRAVSVSLPLEKTGAQTLAELPAQVRGAAGLLDVLRVFRGARVAVHGRRGSFSGRIVGVENMQAASSGDVEADWRLTLKTDGNRLRIIPVAAITRVDLEDRTLSVGLDQSLDVSLSEGNWQPITLSIGLVGRGTHDLVASYIVEMPRWKPAYRLVVGDGGLLLQGWAVVDNVSGEDWNDVRLSLVAGTPMSFIYDLHSPQFTQRPDLSPRGRERAMAPPSDRPGVSARDQLERERASSRAAPSRSAGARPPPAPRPAPADEPSPLADHYEEDEDLAEEALDDALERQAEARVEGTAVGSLFRYDLADPVTVPDRSSTLVAIVNKRVPGGDVVLFRPELTRGSGDTHPYRAAMFRNDSGFTLERGPVTIYAGGTFVGEGFIERMEQATTAFISYSIDGNVSMRSRDGTRREGVRLLKIVDGMVVIEALEIRATTYEVTNRHATPITAFFRTGRRTGWTLRNQPAETVVAPDALMVPVTVPAQGQATLEVEWVRKVERRERFNTQISQNVLDVYLESGKAPPEVARRLREAVAIKAELDDIDKETRRLQKLHTDLSQDQNRVRKNLNMLGRTKGNEALRRELENKLAEQERELGKLSGQLVRLSERRAEQDRKLTVLIRTITLTAD